MTKEMILPQPKRLLIIEKEGTMTTSRYPEGMRYQPGEDWNSTPHHSLGYRMINRTRKILCMFVISVLTFFSTIIAAVWLDFSSAVSNRVINVISKDPEANQTLDINAGKPVTCLLYTSDAADE